MERFMRMDLQLHARLKQKLYWRLVANRYRIKTRKSRRLLHSALKHKE
jgi:homoserine kinase